MLNGNPFVQLKNHDKEMLNKISSIRNSLAHSSVFSKELFNKKVVGNLTLPPRERTPVGFLRSNFRATPKTTQFEALITEMARMGNKLITPSQW